jgi:hypothetical protein
MDGEYREPDIHDVQRGEIIRALVPWFGKCWMRLKTLQYGLADLNIALSVKDLGVHLAFLEGAGLVEMQRAAGPAGDDEAPGRIALVRLTNRGLMMYDRKIPLEPGIRF